MNGPEAVYRIAELAGSILAPSALVTALLYFFGWTRTNAYMAYFGVDRSVLELSTQNYLLRTPELIIRPVVMILLGVLGYAFARTVVRERLPHRYRRWARLAIWSLAGGMIATGILYLYHPWNLSNAAFMAAVLAAGAVLAAVLVREERRSRAQPLVGIPVQVSLIVVALLATFWAEDVYAVDTGRQSARYTAENLTASSEAIVYSHDRLVISGTGVAVSSLTGDDLAYRYRYSGLHLLLHTGNRWFLVPFGWTPINGDTVFVLPDSPTTRVDFRP